MKIGYACVPTTIGARTNRRLLLKDYNEDLLIDTIKSNLKDLKTILIHNVKNDIKLFRISSDIIPLASHEINTYDWKSRFKHELKEIGSYIKDNNIRVSMHPGQYTLINSPNRDTVEKSILDLQYHCDFLDALEMDYSNKIILHVGGVYGNKEEAKQRFIDNFSLLSSSIKNRLVIENDEKNFSLDDVIDISSIVNIPVIFDNLHNTCHEDNDYSINDIFSKIKNTWKEKDGPIKVHYSQQDFDRKKGSHSKTVFIKDFIQYYNEAKTFDPDIMLEVKDKDISVIKCLNTIKELNGETFSENYIHNEWKKYEWLVMEHGMNNIALCNSIKDTFSDIIPLYEAIDTALKSPLDEGGYTLALNDCFNYLKDIITSREISHYNKLISENNLEKCKSYIDKLSRKYSVDAILSTYYLSQ